MTRVCPMLRFGSLWVSCGRRIEFSNPGWCCLRGSVFAQHSAPRVFVEGVAAGVSLVTPRFVLLAPHRVCPTPSFGRVCGGKGKGAPGEFSNSRSVLLAPHRVCPTPPVGCLCVWGEGRAGAPGCRWSGLWVVGKGVGGGVDGSGGEGGGVVFGASVCGGRRAS